MERKTNKRGTEIFIDLTRGNKLLYLNTGNTTFFSSLSKNIDFTYFLLQVK